MEEHLVEGDGMLWVQVLREFYSASRELARPLSDEQAQEMVRYFSTFRTLAEDAGIVLGAIRPGREHMLFFWDEEIGVLRVENPFLRPFANKRAGETRDW